jgi:D-alanyl-D-alanine carboxypeptidase
MLLALLFAVFLVGSTVETSFEESHPPLTPLAARLAAEPSLASKSGEDGDSVFGLPAPEARMVLLRVTHERALPDGYEPPDLTRVGGHTVRALVVPDLTAMIDAAAADGVEIAVISGYRSPAEQTMAFETAVWQEVGRAGESIDRPEAEARATRFVAPPGHSQHQLGTAIDFSSEEVGYGVRAAFAETTTGRWLKANAWQFGFVLPYPKDGEARSGYAYEPWHYRWIGRDLAAVLAHDNYLDDPTRVVDDYLSAAEEVLAPTLMP